MKLIKLDRRHNLYHKGYTYAFVINRWSDDSSKVERAVKDLEGFQWDSTFWGKAPTFGSRPYYIGFKKESTATMALLKI